MKSNLEKSDDPIDGFMILDEGDHSHLAPGKQAGHHRMSILRHEIQA